MVSLFLSEYQFMAIFRTRKLDGHNPILKYFSYSDVCLYRC